MDPRKTTTNPIGSDMPGVNPPSSPSVSQPSSPPTLSTMDEPVVPAVSDEPVVPSTTMDEPVSSQRAVDAPFANVSAQPTQNVSTSEEPTAPDMTMSEPMVTEPEASEPMTAEPVVVETPTVSSGPVVGADDTEEVGAVSMGTEEPVVPQTSSFGAQSTPLSSDEPVDSPTMETTASVDQADESPMSTPSETPVQPMGGLSGAKKMQ